MNDFASATARRRSGGPPLGVLASVAFALTLGAIVVLGIASGGAGLGTPFGEADALLERYAENTVATAWSAMLLFGSAVPLGIFAATAYARQLRLGVRVPGPAIGLFGGMFASVMLAASALLTWVLSRPEILTDAALVQVLALLAFALGGVGYAVGLGLLVAGIAVPAGILRLFPRWIAIAGLVIAAAGEISFLSLMWEPLQVLIPIARFGGGAWLIAAGFLLPIDRPRRSGPRVARAENA